MCKWSYVKKICDYSWWFPGFNKIILLIERSEAGESKGSFPILLFFLSHWKFPQNFHFLKAFSIQWLFQFEKLFTSKFYHDNTSPTQHIQTTKIYWTSDRTSGQQPMLRGNTRKQNLKANVNLCLYSEHLMFLLLISKCLNILLSHTPFIHAKLAFFSKWCMCKTLYLSAVQHARKCSFLEAFIFSLFNLIYNKLFFQIFTCLARDCFFRPYQSWPSKCKCIFHCISSHSPWDCQLSGFKASFPQMQFISHFRSSLF